MKIKLINLGRGKINKEIEIKNPSFSKIYKEVKKHLASKHPDIEETDDPNTFNVLAGIRVVG